MIRVINVTKSFGDLVILKGISLHIRPSEKTVIIGPSGSGKTTLLRCINRLEDIDEGEIYIDGGLITDPMVHGKHRRQSEAVIRRLRTEVGMVFQSFNLFPHMTVLENIVEAPIHVRGLSQKEAHERAFALLEKVGLVEKAHAYPAKLSGGQQQRVAIARSLAMAPKAIAPELICEVLGVMKNLAEEGMTMAIVTHEMGFAREIADTVVVMDGGVIIEEGPPDVIFNSPCCERTQGFLKAVRQKN